MNSEKASPEEAVGILDLQFSYPDSSRAIRNVSLTVATGEKIGVIGPNGAGKSTLFHLCCGLLEPGSGVIRVMDRDVVQGEFNRSVGLVFQNPDNQLICPTVYEDIAFGPENIGISRCKVDERVAEVLELTGIGHIAHKAPHHLSAGEKRMVAIAGVMVLEPEIVFYDEPEANLDIRSRRMVIEFLRRSGETMLIASHDLELILEVCSRTIVLDMGNLCADGSTPEIMSDDELMKAHGMEKPHSLIPHANPHHNLSTGNSDTPSN